MSYQQVYRIWWKKIKALMADQRYERYRHQLIAGLLAGMYLAKSVHLNQIACMMPHRVKKLSIVRQMRRLIAGGVLRVRPLYHPIARSLIHRASQGGHLRLLMDSTKVSARHRLVMVAVAYHKRALPMAWTWVRHQGGHSRTRLQVALLSSIHGMVPEGIRVSLVGDSEFGHTPLIAQLDQWGWQYVLRQRGSYLVHPDGCAWWHRLDDVPIEPGEMLPLGSALVTASQPTTTHLLLYWKRSEKEPWRLATTLSCPVAALNLYANRMWIEEMFGDMKGHGFDLELTRFHHVQRLSRLTLLVCLLYVWLVGLGESVITSGLTSWVDRSDRRDLSIFRLGWDYLTRLLTLGDPIPSFRCPSFSLKVSGS